MKRITTFLLLYIFAFSGCKKDEPVVVQATGVRAIIQVQHHEIPIPNARIFVKYNTVNFPGTDTTLYDARYVANGNGQLILSGLTNGQNAYTFFAKGIDPNWDSTQVTPVYGYQFLITDTHTGETKDYNVSVPVSE